MIFWVIYEVWAFDVRMSGTRLPELHSCIVWPSHAFVADVTAFPRSSLNYYYSGYFQRYLLETLGYLTQSHRCGLMLCAKTKVKCDESFYHQFSHYMIRKVQESFTTSFIRKWLCFTQRKFSIFETFSIKTFPSAFLPSTFAFPVTIRKRMNRSSLKRRQLTRQNRGRGIIWFCHHFYIKKFL